MLKRVFLNIVLTFSIPFAVNADAIDSLKLCLLNAENDSIKVELLNDIANAYINEGSTKNIDSIDSYCIKAIALARKISYMPGLAHALIIDGRFEISNNMHLPKATTCFLEALSIYEKLGDEDGIGGTYLQLGLVSYILLSYDEAIKSFKLAIKRQKNDILLEGLAEYLIAICYSEIDSMHEAENCFSKAEKIFAARQLHHNLSECYMYMGRMFTRANNLARAFEYFKTARKESDLDGETRNSRLDAFYATAYLKSNDIKSAIKFGEKAYALGTSELDEITTMESAGTLYKAYFQQEDFGKAFFYLDVLNRMQGEITNSNKTLLVAEMKSRFEYNKKANEEKIKQEKETAFQKAKLEKQKIIRDFFIGGFVIILIVSIVLYKQYRAKQNANKQLTQSIYNLKNTQAQLVQSEKLASLGQITAGIAHEIKNPLNFVNNFSEITDEMVDELLSTDSSDSKTDLANSIKLNLKKISFHGKRVDQVVQSMLLHSHSTSQEKQLTDLNRLCDDFTSLALTGLQANRPGFTCEVIKSFDTTLPKVTIIPQEISRVILNLLHNSFYAVWKKSTLENKTDGEKNYWPQVTLKTSFQHGVVSVVVKDNGIGIPNKIIPKIFEPFFTTKPTGDGSGLGLSVCYDIMQGHGGNVNVVSRENEFTEFIIQFPVKG